jgi:hypothetical protein
MMDTVLNIGLNEDTVKGMIEATGDPRFVYDSYRRLIQMFGSVVMGVPDEPFEDVITEFRKSRKARSDAELTADDWKAIAGRFKDIFRRYNRIEFPGNPHEQLRLATEAVFKSWNGKRAIDYRNAAKIPHDLGTAVNIQTMVFGNMGDSSATGVAMTRNATTGEKKIEGDYLINAQGEDVVAGIRATDPVEQMAQTMPDMWSANSSISAESWKSTSVTCRTWNSPSSAAPVDAADTHRQEDRAGGRPNRGGNGGRRSDHEGKGCDAGQPRAGGLFPAPAVRCLFQKGCQRGRQTACRRLERVTRRRRGCCRFQRGPGRELGQEGREKGDHGAAGDQAR